MSSILLDEIAFAPASARASVVRALSDGFGGRIGAIVEYELFRRSSRSDLPALSECARSSLIAQIVSLLDDAPSPRNILLQAVHADAMRVPVSLGRSPAWVSFVQRASATAKAAGFSELVAAGLAGAIGELADNIVRHAESPSEGIAAFCRTSDGFEYVVADTGIGMLASLRKAPEFRSLRDDMEALPLAVTPGISSRGRDTGNGYGYRAVFSPLKAASGSIRLRSGSAVLQISGRGITPNQGICSQRPAYQGVVVTVAVSTISGTQA